MDNLIEKIRLGELIKRGNKLYTKAEIAAIDEADDKVEYFELRQMSKKLTLNSLYGAMLSPHFGLGRKEMGASVTACGRAITKHMIETIGQTITGNPVGITWYIGPSKKVASREEGEEDDIFSAKRTVCFDLKEQQICQDTLLSDTDSCYYLTRQDNKEDAVKRADEIAEVVNASFPEFMRKTFFCSSEKYDSLIKAGREIVGRRGLFLNAKKKYTIAVVDQEGFAVSKLKMMGSELKKVDTPKAVQDFLKELMNKILDGQDEKTLEAFVNKSRRSLVIKSDNIIKLGAAKGINNLDTYYAEWSRTEKLGLEKCRLPGHVRAAINYNEQAQLHEGTSAKLLNSGDKGLIFYLLPNEYNLKSIAIPIEFDSFPKWFDEHFKVDRKLTEDKMIDSKIEGIYGALGWEIPNATKTLMNKILKF